MQEITTGSLAAVPLQTSLAIELYKRGYEHVVAFDIVRGVRVLSRTGASQTSPNVIELLGLADIDQSTSAAERAHMALNAVTAYEGPPVCIILDFASRLTVRNDSLSQGEHTLFSRAFVNSLTARPRPFGE